MPDAPEVFGCCDEHITLEKRFVLLLWCTDSAAPWSPERGESEVEELIKNETQQQAVV